MNKVNSNIEIMRTTGILLYTLCCLLAASCIKNGDDEPLPPNPEPVIETDTTIVYRDTTFMATVTYLQGEWMSEYMGFDPMQNTNTAIRRLLVFRIDGSYDSHIQGINDIQVEDEVAYREFEHEHGTYTFDADIQQMTYTVEYDSLLNFFTDKLEHNEGKVQQGGGIQKEYKEDIYFSREKEGKRDWIRVDDNLRAPDDHSARLVYIMKNQ